MVTARGCSAISGEGCGSSLRGGAALRNILEAARAHVESLRSRWSACVESVKAAGQPNNSFNPTARSLPLIKLCWLRVGLSLAAGGALIRALDAANSIRLETLVYRFRKAKR